LLTGNAVVNLGVLFKSGSLIGQKYNVYRILGYGGFGIVYLVYLEETKSVYALKTFKDEYLRDMKMRELFNKEANIWVDLGRHPYLVQAYFVDQVQGRLYIAMEYIRPNEQGLNSLEGYLALQPPDLAQSLRWAIQFCYGIEYAYSKGMRCHRDIKSSNIMISRDKTVKIADFGLAGILDAMRITSGNWLNIQHGKVGLSIIMEGRGIGTPTHMPPEQFLNAANCDERSDIYSFGIVLYQMVTGGKLPFFPRLPMDNSDHETRRFCEEMYRLHSQAPIPILYSPLFPIIQHCLEKDPDRRYQTFKELRADLEALLKHQTGEIFKTPEIGDLDADGWIQKGYSLDTLNRFSEGLQCYDRALEISPKNAVAWNNKGFALDKLGRYVEAMQCFDRAIKINSKYAMPWFNKGLSLCNLGRFAESLQCFDRALEINPKFAAGWHNKGVSLDRLGRSEESLRCQEKALEIDQQDAFAWNSKGYILYNSGRIVDALQCFNKSTEIDPQYARAWNNKALAEDKLGLRLNAINSYKEFIKRVPANYSQPHINYAIKRLRELEGR